MLLLLEEIFGVEEGLRKTNEDFGSVYTKDCALIVIGINSLRSPLYIHLCVHVGAIAWMQAWTKNVQKN